MARALAQAHPFQCVGQAPGVPGDRAAKPGVGVGGPCSHIQGRYRRPAGSRAVLASPGNTPPGINSIRTPTGDGPAPGTSDRPSPPQPASRIPYESPTACGPFPSIWTWEQKLQQKGSSPDTIFKNKERGKLNHMFRGKRSFLYNNNAKSLNSHLPAVSVLPL